MARRGSTRPIRPLLQDPAGGAHRGPPPCPAATRREEERERAERKGTAAALGAMPAQPLEPLRRCAGGPPLPPRWAPSAATPMGSGAGNGPSRRGPSRGIGSRGGVERENGGERVK